MTFRRHGWEPGAPYLDSEMGGGWPTHNLGCPIHDSLIVMSGVNPRTPRNVTQITFSPLDQTVN
jgi:hypothetical protein